MGRVWLVSIVRKQYALFKKSEDIDKFKTIIPDFVTPSFTFFFKRQFKCVSKPEM